MDHSLHICKYHINVWLGQIFEGVFENNTNIYISLDLLKKKFDDCQWQTKLAAEEPISLYFNITHTNIHPTNGKFCCALNTILSFLSHNT